jgi:hypothetical protein
VNIVSAAVAAVGCQAAVRKDENAETGILNWYRATITQFKIILLMEVGSYKLAQQSQAQPPYSQVIRREIEFRDVLITLKADGCVEAGGRNCSI